MKRDTALVAYISVFLLAKAALIRRETRLGRSLAACNLSLGVAFGYSAITTARPHLARPKALRACRLAVAGSVTWGVLELAREARRRWALVS